MSRPPISLDAFDALADSRRRQLIELLARRGAMAVGAIVVALGLPQPAVSKHLGVLRHVGIVAAVKQGQHRFYHLQAMELKHVHDWVKRFESHWSHQLDRIKARAERKANETSGRSRRKH